MSTTARVQCRFPVSSAVSQSK